MRVALPVSRSRPLPFSSTHNSTLAVILCDPLPSQGDIRLFRPLAARGAWERQLSSDFMRWRSTGGSSSSMYTAQTIMRWLHEPAFKAEIRPGNPSTANSLAMRIHLTIVSRDTHDALSRMRHLLDDLEVGMTIDSVLQSNVSRWRAMLNKMLDMLDDMTQELRDVLDGFNAPHPPGTWSSHLSWTSLAEDLQEAWEKPALYLNPTPLSESDSTLINALLKPLFVAIDGTTRRTQRAASTMQSTVALLESKRGIAEAESVTKLTELAFFFIPISVTATFFSMPVNVRSLGPFPLLHFDFPSGRAERNLIGMGVRYRALGVLCGIACTGRQRIWNPAFHPKPLCQKASSWDYETGSRICRKYSKSISRYQPRSSSSNRIFCVLGARRCHLLRRSWHSSFHRRPSHPHTLGLDTVWRG